MDSSSSFSASSLLSLIIHSDRRLPGNCTELGQFKAMEAESVLTGSPTGVWTQSRKQDHGLRAASGG